VSSQDLDYGEKVVDVFYVKTCSAIKIDQEENSPKSAPP